MEQVWFAAALSWICRSVIMIPSLLSWTRSKGIVGLNREAAEPEHIAFVEAG